MPNKKGSKRLKPGKPIIDLRKDRILFNKDVPAVVRMNQLTAWQYENEK